MIRFIKYCLFTIAFLLFIGSSAYAQCSMCRATAESNLHGKQHNHVGAGLNKGILYLMTIPYVVGGIGFLIYMKNKGKIKSYLNGTKS